MPINTDYDIFIFGYGGRVKNDILPVIHKVLPNSRIFIYATSKRKVNIHGRIELLQSFDGYSGPSKTRNNIAFISVPPTEQLQVFNKIKDKIDQFERVFIDTPIVEKSLIGVKNVEVLEDFPFSPIGLAFKYMKKENNSLILYRCLFKYHGISLLRILMGDIDGMKLKSLRLFRLRFTFIFSPFKIIIVSPRKYETCKIFGLNHFFNPRRLKIEYSPEECCVKVDGYVVDVINDYEKSLITTIRSIDVYEDIDVFKQIGLSRLIHKSIMTSEIQYSCSKAYFDYMSGRKI